MRIAILVEGETEQAFRPVLIEFLSRHLADRMPKVKFFSYDGRIPKAEKLRRLVENLRQGKDAFDAVIALTDVYTGTADFKDGTDAKAKMREWVGPNDRFFPHVAQYDFEAWLLPFWPTIQKLAGHNRNGPPGAPERVNHQDPPSRRIREIFRLGTCRDDYVKPRDALRILRDNNLDVAVEACSELKAFLNTIISLSGGNPLP